MGVADFLFLVGLKALQKAEPYDKINSMGNDKKITIISKAREIELI